MRILFVSNLFPNVREPNRGRFNLNQLKALKEFGLDIVVVSPVSKVPFFEFPQRPTVDIPVEDIIETITVFYPRSYYVPKWTGTINAALMEKAVCPFVARLKPDLIWGSFAFPDGVAAVALARKFKLPSVVSLLGSDVNVYFEMPARKKVILNSLQCCDLILSKSHAIKIKILDGGIPESKIKLDYNGVDQKLFCPRDRNQACLELGIDPNVERILFVGNLVSIKNVPLLLRATALMRKLRPRIEIVIIGEGTSRPELEGEVRTLALEKCVHFKGLLEPKLISLWMNSSNMLCLPSLNEGVPNVILEALASGIPVVASKVGGVEEIHPGEQAGGLFASQDVDGCRKVLEECLSRKFDSEELAKMVEGYTWSANAKKVHEEIIQVTTKKTSIQKAQELSQ